MAQARASSPFEAADGVNEKRSGDPRRGRGADAVPARPDRTNGFATLILSAVVALAPLPFGSQHPSVVALWVLLLALAAMSIRPRGLRHGHFLLLALAGVLFLALLVVVALQVATIPLIGTAIIDPVWKRAGELLGRPLDASASVVTNQPLIALGPSFAAMGSLVCAFLLCADARRARKLFYVVAWAGAAYAVFAIAAFLFDPTRVLWREKLAYRNALTGTFINRNTAAAFFGTCAVVWLALLGDGLRRLMPPGSRDVVGSVLRAPVGRRRKLGLYAGMWALCCIAMLMTLSRAGILLSLAAMLAAGTLLFQRRLTRTSSVAIVLAVGTAAVLTILQLFGTGVGGRFDEGGFADEARLAAYRATLRMIADHPWLGTGLGTFAWSFPPYRGSDVTLLWVWDRAHSTALEIVAEMGIPFAILVFAAWVTMFVVLVHGVRTRRRGRVYPCTALALFSMVSLHSLIDFPLQIPGFAIVAFALVGAGLAQSMRPLESTRRRRAGAANSAY